MNRLLLYFVPNKQATMLAGGLSAIAFLLGLVDMLSRDFNSASFYLNLSIGILAGLFLLKYLSMRATYRVAEEAQARLRRHMTMERHRPLPRELSEAEERAREKAQMADLVSALKQALHNIEPDSPARPKYEATLQMMERASRQG